MKAQRVLPCLLTVMAAWLAVTGPALAQEESEAQAEPERAGDVMIEIGTWVSQPVGLEYRPATRLDPLEPFSADILEPDPGTDAGGLYRVHYVLPGTAGILGFEYYAHENDADLAAREPGQFVFGELLAMPVFPGVDNDSLADGVTAVTRTVLRDWRIEYRRPAFRGARASSEWFVGWRRVEHKRFQDAAYFALAPQLPPLISPPIPEPPDSTTNAVLVSRLDLLPLPDVVGSNSRFDGRGPTIGLDLDFPLWKDKFLLEGGASFALLRGDLDADYFSQNSVYVLGFLGETTVLFPPYDDVFGAFVNEKTGKPCEPTEPMCEALIDSVFQTVARTGIQAKNLDTDAQVIDGKLGFRWRALKWFEVFGGFRATRYSDVGLSLRPQNIQTIELRTLPNEQTASFVVNVGDVEEIDRSATYEGFYAGITLFVF